MENGPTDLTTTTSTLGSYHGKEQVGSCGSGSGGAVAAKSSALHNSVQLGIKRKLSGCSENEEILLDRTMSTSTSSDDGLDYPSLAYNPSSYSPTLRKLSFGPPPSGVKLTASPSSSPKTITRKLRIVHDRYNPFLIDRLLESIISHFSLSQLKTAALVSKRWNIFASNRLNQLMFYIPPYDLFSSTDPDNGEDIQEAVCGLEKIKTVVNQRLQRLSQLRRHRLTARFLGWRDNGQHKQAMPSPPPWAFWLHTYGFPLSEFRTYTVDEVFYWIMNNYQMDDQSKEEWSSLIMESNIVAFVFRPCGR